VTVLTVSALAAAGCAQTVNKILVDPAKYRNHEVTLSGRVVDSFSLANRGAYRFADSTGELWIISDRGVPRKGAQVKVRGTIREGFNLGFLGDRIKLPGALSSGIVMVESSRKARE
jgi:hypothetical protein